MSVNDRKPIEHLSHWYHVFPGLRITSEDFYGELYRRIGEHQFPMVEMGCVDFRESGLLSAKRRYLRVMRGELAFDICGAPFGNNLFFVSSWLGRLGLNGCGVMALGCLAMIPAIGLFAERGLRPMTCYESDTALVFQETIQSILVTYLDELCGTQEITPLAPADRKVAMKRIIESA